MSFSFAFDDGDIEDSASPVNTHASEPELPRQIAAEAIAPRLHCLKSLLETLPSKISYSVIQIGGPDGLVITVPRRELFDVRAQLMAEDHSSEQSFVAGLTTDDITPNVYEGGFKTWECSIDLASHLVTPLRTIDSSQGGEYHFIEVGAGTALPTSIVLQHFVRHSNPASHAVHLSVADYNQSVLETTTIPNLLLAWYFACSATSPPLAGDLDITKKLLYRFQEDLLERGIHISGISGAWSDDLSRLLVPFDGLRPQTYVQTIFLASETIYSPTSIDSFTRLLMKALKESEFTGGQAKALIAAKRVYFGVGGGVDEFLKILIDVGGRPTIAWESTGSGVGRVIMDVTIDGQ